MSENLGAGARLAAVLSGSGPRFPVAGDLDLGGAVLQVTTENSTFPDEATLIAHAGTGGFGHAFKNLPEGTIVAVGSAFYSISYTGGDGNDVVLARAEAPPQVTLSANGRVATFTDVDGDRVTITISKGSLSPDQFTLRAEGLGGQLERITLPADR